MTESSSPVAESALLRHVGAGVRVKRAVIEIGLILALYVTYCASRTLASDDFAPARGRALDILAFERAFRFDAEAWLNDQFAQHDWLGLVGSYWYATTHYVVTAAILVWVYRRSASGYVTARRALVVATLIALAFYLVMPTAPPRLVEGGYADVLCMHSGVGWWAADSAAPKGMGNITNELAAFPSLHAGWALWVAIVLIRAGVPRIVRGIGLAYDAVMTIVITGTGNHWVVDVVVGWAVVLVAFGCIVAWEIRSPALAHEDEPLAAVAMLGDHVTAGRASRRWCGRSPVPGLRAGSGQHPR